MPALASCDDVQHRHIVSVPHPEPIAIVGIGTRLPGDATNAEKFWDLISAGRNLRSEVPKDRFNIDAYYHPHGDFQGSVNTRGGYFLKEDVAYFDAPFFSLTTAEANSMDPQQRLLLEVVYESLENGMLYLAATESDC